MTAAMTGSIFPVQRGGIVLPSLCTGKGAASHCSRLRPRHGCCCNERQPPFQAQCVGIVLPTLRDQKRGCLSSRQVPAQRWCSHNERQPFLNPEHRDCTPCTLGSEKWLPLSAAPPFLLLGHAAPFCQAEPRLEGSASMLSVVALRLSQ